MGKSLHRNQDYRIYVCRMQKAICGEINIKEKVTRQTRAEKASQSNNQKKWKYCRWKFFICYFSSLGQPDKLSWEIDNIEYWCSTAGKQSKRDSDHSKTSGNCKQIHVNCESTHLILKWCKSIQAYPTWCHNVAVQKQVGQNTTEEVTFKGTMLQMGGRFYSIQHSGH